jgi:beta-glucanase (GH16 family)
MKRLILTVVPVIVFCMISCAKKENILPDFVPIAEVPKVYSFESSPFWSDEFEGNGLPDPSKWGYDVGGSGWGNNELQYYTSTANNVNVNEGQLIITAKKETFQGKSYTSSRLVSKNGPEMLYGRIEVKAKIPAGRGSWPAIWMLPNDYAYGSWPKSGEIDIMEHVGYNEGKVHFSIHNELYNAGNSKSSIVEMPTATSDFHIYRTDWTPESIKGYYDDKLIFTYANDGKGSAGWPFDKPFHILLNIAVGGNWGGIEGVDDSIFPIQMQVDYVRFYKMVAK